MNRIRSLALATALPLATLLAAGCGDGGGGAAPPPARPSDGLLGDAALQRVVELQTARDAAALVALLADPAAAVRARAAFALGSVQDRGAVPALVGALADADPSVRRDAAFALGQSGDPAAVAPLAELLGGEGDAEVRSRVIEALGKIPAVAAVQALTALELDGAEDVERILAVARLGGAKGVATREGQDLLLARLDDPDPEVRVRAAYYFGRVPDPTAWASRAPRVREALDGYGEGELAAMYLIQGLARQASPADGTRFRRWLSSARDWRIRVNAANALAALPPDSENREALFTALDDPNELVAASAAEALGRGAPVPTEAQRMKSWVEANPTRWQVAAPLLVQLARVDEREFVFGWMDALPPDDALRWSVAFRAVASMPGAEALDRLEGALASPDPRIQGGAVSALVQRWGQDRVFAGNQERYFAMFSAVLGSGSLQAAYSAAQALADPFFVGLGSAGVLVEAWAGLSAPDELEPMLAVLESLGRIGDPAGIPVLEEGARSGYPALRQAAVAALDRMGREAPAAEAPEVAAAAGETTAGAAGPPALDWAFLAELGAAPTLVLETDQGTIRLRLDPEGAPLTVQTVTRLAREGRFDGVPFHRVVPNFVVQGGDFTSGDGFGGPGFTITSEFNLLPFREGVAGMASAGKDTEGSQYFITHSMQPHLDGAYTTFGWVTSGMDVVARLRVGDRVVRATVEAGEG